MILVTEHDLQLFGGAEGLWKAYPTLKQTPAGQANRVWVMPDVQLKYTSVGSGAGALALAKALAAARSRGAVLIIAKLDRLARNVHFISGLIEQRVPIVAADMPDADITMLQIYAVMAEREARAIGERTRDALAAAKARGQVLGANGRVLADRNKAEAVDRLAPIAERLRGFKAEGLTLRRIADTLNADGIASPGGASWHPGNVQRALARIGGDCV